MAGSDFGDTDTSDVNLSTVQIGADAEVTDWARGHLLLLFEEDATEPMDVDEGTIELGRSEEIPVYLRGGRMYLPFGAYETNMVSDPFTLVLGETRQSALELGIEQSGAYASAYVFNCDIEEAGESDDHAECFGGRLGYGQESEELKFNVGAGYTNSLVDSDGLEGFLADNELTVADRAGAFAIHAKANIGPVDLMSEVISATDELQFEGGASSDEPLAWYVEAGYRFPLMDKEAVIGVAYQSSDNLAGFLPESRIMGTLGVALHENITTSLEYAHDEDYDVADGGTGESADTVTLHLALFF